MGASWTESFEENRESIWWDSNLLLGTYLLVFSTVIKIDWIDTNSDFIVSRRKCWIDDFVVSIWELPDFSFSTKDKIV